ncbi:signal transduction histidine kinase [Weissella soli]|uniref:histidine kinase n=2 Tax=Weissella soli TaxID=155866 RepID=A0A288QXJ7_9LACO|nr:Histidine kinase [Weissella soli]RDL05384.1 signal transduction histidine kinase [Weissella soli]
MMRLRQQMLTFIAIIMIVLFAAGLLLMQLTAHMVVVSQLGHFCQSLVMIFLMVGLLVSILGMVSVQRLSKRLQTIQEGTRCIARGDYKTTLAANGHDEISDLAQAINLLSNTLTHQKQEIDTQTAQYRTLMANAAHEMRTPLTTISGIVEGLQYDVIAEQDKLHAYAMIKNEADRLARLVKHTLDYGRLQQGQIRLQRQTFDVTPLINALIDQLSDKARLAKDHLIYEQAAPVIIHADQDYFIQILYNLVNNAIQFTANGTITIKTWREARQTLIRISDTGIGMTSAQVTKIWEPYYKADPTRIQSGETGLGLAIVRQLVQAHGGTISVHSVVGQGTIFAVTLPDLPENQ